MKKYLIATSVLFALSGCGSDPVKEETKAAVEDRTPAPVQTTASKPAPVVPPVKPAQTPLNPLKDPNNILSKRSVFFDYDSDRIRDEFRPMLQAHAKYLMEHASDKMLIQGNCDERGSREYNIALGQRRSEAVKKVLVLMGARESQIEAVSLGEEKPRCAEQSEACWAQNRRGDMLHSGEF